MVQRGIRPAVVYRLVGAGSLASGAALVTHILAGIALPLALILTYGLATLGVAVLLWQTPSQMRHLLIHRIKVGLLAGVLATLIYDVTKLVLSQVDPSPYDPFEAFRHFGLALIGPDSTQWVTYGTGAAFHLLNGLSFGVAFCLFLGQRGLIAGVAWGFFLEFFQLTLYPGWLDIRFYQEFVQVSVLAHAVYGGVLGFVCQRGLRENR